MGILDPVIQYYITYGPSLIIITLVLSITYMFISNFASVKSAYMCSSLKNAVSGEISKCFSSRIGSSCKQTDIGYTHGWCNDPDNYGPLRGTSAGPFSVKCDDWIWNSADCPPDVCSTIKAEKWGWCADKGIQRAMRGQACGPYKGKCENWVWHAKSCPSKCGESSCLEDSCICSTVKARYVVLKRVDGKDTPINISGLEVYDPSGVIIAPDTMTPSLWPQFEDEATYGPQFILDDKDGTAQTVASKDAYMQLDLKTEKAIGRIIIRNRTDKNKDYIVGTALVLRKSDNSSAVYRKITNAQDLYNIEIGKTSSIQATTDRQKADAASIAQAKAASIAQAIADKAAADKAIADKAAADKAAADKILADKLAEERIAKAKAAVIKVPVTIPDRFRIKSKSKFNLCLDDGGGLHGKSVVKLALCDPNSINQHYIYDAKNKIIKNTDKSDTCIRNYGAKNPLRIDDCNPNKGQQFTYSLDKQKFISQDDTTLCMDDGGGAKPGSTFTLWPCENNSSNQGFELVSAPFAPKPSVSWSKIPGNLTVVRSNKDWSWSVDKGLNIYMTKDPIAGNWKKMDGKATSIAVGPDNVWIVGTDGYNYKRPADGSGKWKKIPGNLTQISISPNGEVWGINAASENNIWYCSKTATEDCTGGWHRLAKFTSKAKHIDAGENMVVATTVDNQVIYGDTKDGNVPWNIIPGQFRVVSVGADALYGLDPFGNMSVCKLPCEGRWTKVDGKLNSIDVYGKGLIGVGVDNSMLKGDVTIPV